MITDMAQGETAQQMGTDHGKDSADPTSRGQSHCKSLHQGAMQNAMHYGKELHQKMTQEETAKAGSHQASHVDMGLTRTHQRQYL